MPKSNMTRMKEFWALDIVKGLNYDLNGTQGKLIFKDLMKLTFATLVILRAKFVPLKKQK